MVKAKLRKKYSRPSHLWQMDRIKEEAQLRKEYGYKNKKEIWKVQSVLRKFRAQARRLIPLTDKQAQLEKQQLLSRLASLGLVNENAQIEDVLALTIRDLLERRLQTLVFRKKMANSIKQARQFITHGHIVIGDKKVTSPSYMVKVSEEPYIGFAKNSPLADEDHPERVVIKEKELGKQKAEEVKEEKESEEEEEAKEILETAEEIGE
ncbi:MAG: 30S ribosomal protein S4 [Nanoarchaeota archaeon]|nr:30S ribosomal protein S4 [Nanoarchaeota archaeon]